MRFELKCATLDVSPATPLHVSKADGRSLRVTHGRVWITQQGSLDDAFLFAGDVFHFDGDGSVIITAENTDGTSSRVAFDGPLTVRSRMSERPAWLRLAH